MSCNKTRKEIEKAIFKDGRGKIIKRFGPGLNINSDVVDDRHINIFYKHRWLQRLKQMKTSKQVEKQITNFLTNIPSFKYCEDLQNQFLVDISNERERVMPVAKTKKGQRKKEKAAAKMMNNISMSNLNAEFSNNNFINPITELPIYLSNTALPTHLSGVPRAPVIKNFIGKINNIPVAIPVARVIKGQASQKGGGEEGEEDCSICLAPINDGRALKSCHTGEGEHPHVFHEECLNYWLSMHGNNNNSCPLDRMKCLTDAQYDEEFRGNDAAQAVVDDAAQAAAEQAAIVQVAADQDAITVQAVTAGIPTEAEDNLEIREDLPYDGFDDDWNAAFSQHGPWWNRSDCDHCDAYQWFLTNHGLYTNQAAFDGDWDSWAGNLICPQHDVTMCESCGERFVDDDENWPGYALRNPDSGDDYCEDCFRERYSNDPDIENLNEFVNNVREGKYSGPNAMPLPHRGGGRRRKRKTRKSKKRKTKRRRRKKRKHTRRRRR